MPASVEPVAVVLGSSASDRSLMGQAHSRRSILLNHCQLSVARKGLVRIAEQVVAWAWISCLRSQRAGVRYDQVVACSPFAGLLMLRPGDADEATLACRPTSTALEGTQPNPCRTAHSSKPRRERVDRILAETFQRCAHNFAETRQRQERE